jgi:hypothetical protein
MMMRVHRFLEAFSAAAHDVALEERGCQIYHFFDSDFLGRLIFGHRDQLNLGLIQHVNTPRAGNESQRLLMGALVGQGLGAPPLMRALLPHLYEVRRAVEGPRIHEDPQSLRMTSDELGQSLDDLQSALQADEKPDELLMRFLDQGPQIFYGVELLSGHWESRLGRVLNLGIREPSPFDEDSEVVDTQAFEVLAKLVGDVSDGRGGSGVSGLRDAMALATLARAVANGAGTTLVRFYTETDRIHRAWKQSAEMRALLTYEHDASDPRQLDYGEHGVLRTVYYYLIRSLIPELGYRRESAEAQLRPDAPIAKIAADLKQAAIGLQNGGIREDDLSGVRVGKSTLGDYIKELTELSPYGTAWRTLKGAIPPGVPRRLVRQLQEVVEGEHERTDDLDASFQRHVKLLSARTRDVGEFTGVYMHLMKVLTNWRGSLQPRNGRYCEHVGLTRWGLVPSDADEAALGRLMEEYGGCVVDDVSERDGKLSTACAGFIIGLTRQLRGMSSVSLRGPDGLADYVAVLGFLSFLDDHKSVARYGKAFVTGLVNVSKRGSGDDPRWIAYGAVVENLVAVAEIGLAVAAAKKQRPLRGKAEEELLFRGRALVARLDESNRVFPTSTAARALAQGYVTFHMWLAFNPSVMDHRGAEPPRLRQPGLMKESLDVCSAALESCEPDSAMHPLLLNHCVYVASTAMQVDDRVQDLARRLELVHVMDGESQSYRIDDTLGFFYYVRAAAKVGAHAECPEPDDIDTALEDLGEARNWFAKLPEDIEDSEVRVHRLLRKRLAEELTRKRQGARSQPAEVSPR